MTRVAVVGLGKMGLSHLSIARATAGVELVGVCDASSYVLGVLERYTGAETYTDYERMLREARPEAVIIATPSRAHGAMVRTAIEHGVHVFCEKPFTLDPHESEELAAFATSRGIVTQVGYHNHFVGAFQEVRRLLQAGAIGDVTHVAAEAYGPVVLKPKGSSWRTRRSEGGGCLYDYAAHPLDLLQWYLGEPAGVSGTTMKSVFSREIDDVVTSTLFYPGDVTAQLTVDWSDPSQRKMTTRVSLWGTAGRIYADRQECQVYLRDDATLPTGYAAGWNVRYTTELTQPVGFYLRGEEYSAQIEAFVRRVDAAETSGDNDFASASATDRAIGLIVADAAKAPATTNGAAPVRPGVSRSRSSRPRLRALQTGIDRLRGAA